MVCRRFVRWFTVVFRAARILVICIYSMAKRFFFIYVLNVIGLRYGLLVIVKIRVINCVSIVVRVCFAYVRNAVYCALISCVSVFSFLIISLYVCYNSSLICGIKVRSLFRICWLARLRVWTSVVYCVLF